ncbi:MAG: DUF4292 domain-containing protein [Bacteroidota bacterium]
MRKNILNRLLILALVLTALGCRPKKVIVTTPPVSGANIEVKEDKKPENIALLRGKDLLFNTLSLKGKASLAINGDENNVTMLIRIEKDKRIWLSITAPILGEVARALVTPDSLFLRNNLQKTYTKKPFSYVYKYTNKQLDFGLLQAVFSGNTLPGFTTVNSDLTLENGVWVLSGTSNDLVYRSVFNTLLKTAETTLNDAKAAQALKVVYGNYTPINAALFPSNLKINSMSGTKTITVDLNFTKIDANVPLEFPFTVPKNYELIN